MAPRCSMRIWRCFGGIQLQILWASASDPGCGARTGIRRSGCRLDGMLACIIRSTTAPPFPASPGRALRIACLCALLLGLWLGVYPGLAHAEVSNPFPGVTAPHETESQTATTKTTAASSSSSGSSSNSDVILVGIVIAVVLIGAIAYFIMRDARSVAPVADPFEEGRSRPDRAARLRKRRAKAKQAREQRKRNR